MRILVYGAGAIGSVLGGFLAHSGHDITLLGRPWHMDAIKRDGLKLSGIWGDKTLTTLKTATSLEEALPGSNPFDWIFVSVKAYQTAIIAPTLKKVLGLKTLVCSFQNGLGNYEALAAAIPSDRIAQGRVIFGVTLEPGRAHVTVAAGEVLVGAIDGRVSKTRLRELAEAIKGSGVPSKTTNSILTDVWAKVLYNCALNGLSTVYEVPYGKLLQHSLAPELMHKIIDEVYQVADAHRIPLEPKTASAYLDLLLGKLIPLTGGHYPSMLQDIRRGKPTEIDSLNGAVSTLAKQVGLRAPINAMIARLVREKERFAGVPKD